MGENSAEAIVNLTQWSGELSWVARPVRPRAFTPPRADPAREASEQFRSSARSSPWLRASAAETLLRKNNASSVLFRRARRNVPGDARRAHAICVRLRQGAHNVLAAWQPPTRWRKPSCDSIVAAASRAGNATMMDVLSVPETHT